MELLEKNHEYISDGTYLAFRYFMEHIVPEFLNIGLEQKTKEVFIPINNKQDGVYIGKHYLGKICYSEFISYIYGLSSYKGFRLPDPRNVINSFNVPFDLRQLIEDYYMELQKEEYPLFSKKEENNLSYSLQELTDAACHNFEENILKDIIANALNDKYEVIDILDVDGTTVMSRTLYLNIEIVNDNLVLGGFNLGRVDIGAFLNYLSTLPFYIGKDDRYFLTSGEYKIIFDLYSLISYYNQNFSR